MSDTNRMLTQGKLIAMEGSLLASLNDAGVKAMGIVRECIDTKNKILENLTKATITMGEMNKLSQQIAGAAGVAGNSFGLVTSLGGIYGAFGHANALNKLSAQPEIAVVGGGAGGAGVQLNGNAAGAGGLPGARMPTDAELALKRSQIEAEWAPYGQYGIAGMGQMVAKLSESCGQLASAPLTATAAEEQAQQQKAQSLQETTSSQMGSTESAIQNIQGFFGSTAQQLGGVCQYMVILAQAH